MQGKLRDSLVGGHHLMTRSRASGIRMSIYVLAQSLVLPLARLLYQVIALSSRGSMFDPGPIVYMDKLAVGPDVPPASVSLNFSVEQNLHAVAKALGKSVK